MKKLYLLLFFSISTIFYAQVASCSLDPAFVASNRSGIWPDSITNFITGNAGSPYLQNLTIKVPKDTVVSPLTFCFNRIEVTSPTGINNFNLPPGLNLLAGNNVTLTSGVYKFPGNANTCALISGTPTTEGTYTLQFKVQPFLSTAPCSGTPNVNGGIGTLSPPTTLKYYIITINPPAGLQEEVNSKSLSLSNIPNPFSTKSTIKFFVKDETNATISVYNLLGSKIYSQDIRTAYGENSIEFDATGLSNGVYFYKLHYKNHTETKRMVINSSR